MGAALIVLAAVVAVAGPALTLIPLAPLRLIVGALLAVFGLQWLRKAILRASGYKDLHDEEGIYARQVAAARAAPGGRRGWVHDWYAFTLSFKGVLLEGLEVVFIAHHLRRQPGQRRPGRAERRRCRGRGGRRGRGGARAAGPGPGEYPEVRRRGHADLVRDLLGRGGGRGPGPGTTRPCW